MLLVLCDAGLRDWCRSSSIACNVGCEVNSSKLGDDRLVELGDGLLAADVQVAKLDCHTCILLLNQLLSLIQTSRVNVAERYVGAALFSKSNRRRPPNACVSKVRKPHQEAVGSLSMHT